MIRILLDINTLFSDNCVNNQNFSVPVIKHFIIVDTFSLEMICCIKKKL